MTSSRSRSPEDFGKRFHRLADVSDGPGLHALLRASEIEETNARIHGITDATALEVLRAQHFGSTEEGLEALCGALRAWCARYLAQPDPQQARWMLPPLLWLASRPRRLAAELDHEGRTERHQKRLVEALREHFQKLHRDKHKREGALAVCCELLRLYFRLGQASQCSFLLAAVSQGQKGERLDLEALPKALAVTLCFLWGKHCVLDGNVPEAEEKLSWALANCPPKAEANRRRILAYLVPCRLRSGRFPSRQLLQNHGLESLTGVAKACAVGDVRLFSREFEEREVELITAGTYLVVEKLKLLVYRNLCCRVHALVAAELDSMGKAETRHKQDLLPYERAFQWQDGCDADETMCLLANLIYIGAIRGYLSDEHRKIVFSKDTPFPPPAGWCPRT